MGMMIDEVEGLYRLQHMLPDTYSTVQRRKEYPAIPPQCQMGPKQNSERARFSVSGIVCDRKKGGPCIEQSIGGSRIRSAGFPIDNIM
jgi:hypothetical protein